MARVPYLESDELPAEYRSLLEPALSDVDGYVSPSDGSSPSDDEAADYSPPHLYRALANNPSIFESFRILGSQIRAESGLSVRERELVILAVARAADAEYEWHQHVRIATNGPLSREEILAVSTGDTAPFDEAETAVIEYSRAFADGSVTDETHDRLAEHVDTATLVGATKLAQFYYGLAATIDALAIEPETTFVGWGLENFETS